MRASANLAPREPLRRKVSQISSEHEKEIFTSYLRILDLGAEPSQKTFDALWQALRSAVIKELRRRSAWTSPPSYLGVFGWESWQAWDPGPGHTGSALEELLTDCYTFVFLEQRPRLRAQMAVKPNVDGLVSLYLRNYLHDRRKHYDLLGFRIFETLQSAALQALEAGELWILRGDSRVVNATVLATSPEAGPSDVVGVETLTPIIEGWGYDLLPDLITAGGRRRRQVVDRLRRHLLRLEAESVGGFRFKDLADALKRDVRARWAAIFDFEEGETAIEDDAQSFADVARLVRPDQGMEARDSFDKLVTCVSNQVDALAEPEKTRHYLRNLWGFLRAWASGERSEALPSARRLSHLLYIPRKRLPYLWTILGQLVQHCQAALAGPPYERDAAEEKP